MQKLMKLTDMIKNKTRNHPTKIDMRGMGAWKHNSWRVDWDGNEYHIADQKVYVGDKVVRFYSDCIVANERKYPVSWRSLQKAILDVVEETA